MNGTPRGGRGVSRIGQVEGRDGQEVAARASQCSEDDDGTRCSRQCQAPVAELFTRALRPHGSPLSTGISQTKNVGARRSAPDRRSRPHRLSEPLRRSRPRLRSTTTGIGRRRRSNSGPRRRSYVRRSGHMRLSCWCLRSLSGTVIVSSRPPRPTLLTAAIDHQSEYTKSHR
jgi:hypothetical protein